MDNESFSSGNEIKRFSYQFKKYSETFAIDL